jgi:hypothetical protein
MSAPMMRCTEPDDPFARGGAALTWIIHEAEAITG